MSSIRAARGRLPGGVSRCRCWQAATRKPAAPGWASTAVVAWRWSPTCARPPSAIRMRRRAAHWWSPRCRLATTLPRGCKRRRSAPRPTTASTCWWATRCRCAVAAGSPPRGCTTSATGSMPRRRRWRRASTVCPTAFSTRPGPRWCAASLPLPRALRRASRSRPCSPCLRTASWRATVHCRRPACRRTGSVRCPRCRSAPTATAPAPAR
jgi:hypothetical protein